MYNTYLKLKLSIHKLWNQIRLINTSPLKTIFIEFGITYEISEI